MPGADAVHRDALARDLLGERVREADDRELGRAIVCKRGGAELPGDRRDVDDPPAASLRAHLDDRRLVHEERALGVHVHDVVPLRLAHLGDGAGGDHAGRVDHNIDPPEALDRLREHGLDGRFVRDIRVDGEGVAADLLRHCLRRGVAANVGGLVLVVGAPRVLQPVEGKPHALAPEQQRDALADASTATGDERNLPLYV